MAGFVKGDIVVIPFPFSDLSGSKRRPALVIAGVAGDDLILCQITSQHKKDPYAIPATPADLKSGSLIKLSHIRPNRIFTADENIIIKKVATLNENTINEVINKIIAILEA
ncbi:MAG: type II toxin-antitoxin system PemK/MazF family toxin [Phaeodactylibacter sp.]|nr:type II toxin-antitoxin system PemK/MazF family toxin [Phaeodactylibacter sp.]MCB9264498.1 type II toxin-antitoxin system PemK/MazF family toxin [Lewinellaceae bacterium]MCB9286159.1 type II toxin-antitoxin system PemK/MazF family toxin [Lewinellaceae bacterium]